MRTITVTTACAVAALFVSVSIDTPVEAKRGVKAPHVAKNVGRSVGNAARNAGRSVTRGARWGVNGVWVGTGLGAGHARLTNNCNYYYKRYQETRDLKWRNKYNTCI